MDRKARENLDAARRLLGGDPATNAAPARAYYAAYHAVWCAMVDEGHAVPRENERRYFRHVDLPSDAARANILCEDSAEDLAFLRDRRVTADYFEEDIELDTAQEALKMATALVVSLLGEEEAWI